MDGEIPEGYYSLKETAEYGHVTRQAIFVAIYKDKLKAIKIGRHRYIKREDYDAYRLNKYNREERVVDGERVFDFEKGEYSVQQISKIYSHSTGRFYGTQRIYYLIHSGQLKAFRKGKTWVVKKEDAVEFFDKENKMQPFFVG